jgi:hypothetical protein
LRRALDSELLALGAALRRGGLAVAGIGVGSDLGLHLLFKQPHVEVVLEDASGRPPRGPSLPLSRFRVVLRGASIGSIESSRILARVHECVRRSWGTGLGQWLSPETHGDRSVVEPTTSGLQAALSFRFPLDVPFWSEWRLSSLEAEPGGFRYVFEGPPGERLAYRLCPDRLAARDEGTPLGAFVRVSSAPTAGSGAERADRVVRLLMKYAFDEGSTWGRPHAVPGEHHRLPSPWPSVGPAPAVVQAAEGPTRSAPFACLGLPCLPLLPSAPAQSGSVMPSPGLCATSRGMAADQVRVALLCALDIDTVASGRTRLPFCSLGPARLCGALQAAGYAGCRVHDLNEMLRTQLDSSPQDLDLRAFGDASAVDDYLLRSRPNQVGRALDRLLDALSLEPADLYGVSLVRQHLDHPDAELALAFDLCLVHGLKLRNPACVTVVGGLIYLALHSLRAVSLRLLERCPSLDFVVEGAGDLALVGIADAVFGGKPLGGPGLAWERHAHQYYLCPAPATEVQTPARESRGKANVLVHGRYPLSAYKRLPAVPARFENAGCYRLSGHDLAAIYDFPPALRNALSAHLDRTILPLTHQFMVGCSSTCAFCISANVPVSALPARAAVDELMRLRDEYETNHLIFFHNAINWSRSYALEFTRALIEANAGLRWIDSLVLHNLDERLADRLRESGMVRADVGVESASNRVRRAMRKPLTIGQARARMQLLRDAGIWCDINLIVGLPGERPEDVEATREFLAEASGLYVNCAIDPFYLVDVSPLAHDAGHFGLSVRPVQEMTSKGMRIPYDELGGPRWEERTRAAAHDAGELRRWVAGLPGPGLANASNDIPFHLIFFLYEVYGHAGLSAILEAYEALTRARPVPEGPATRPPAAR